MGKVRVKTIGIEEQEQAEKQKAKARAEAKKQQAAAKSGQSEKLSVAETEPEKKQKKMEQKPSVKSQGTSRSKAYQAAAAQIDKTKVYSLQEALELLQKVRQVKFDETVELHITTTEKGISGNVTLPHGTGKKTRVTILNYAEDAKGVEDTIKNIEAGKIAFDILIATPDTMPKLARVARVLGPRGLMPNPKNGTITPKPNEVAKKFEGGQVNFKTESKFPLIHIPVGKKSFTTDQLTENIKTVLKEIQQKQIKQVTLSATMSPGIKIAY